MNRTIGYFLVAGLLVGLFVQTFEIWRLLTRHLGDHAAWVPFGFSALMLGLMLSLAKRPWNGPKLFAAIAIILLGFWLCDPQFPAKRIHVAQYLLLSLWFRWVMIRHFSEADTVIFSAFAATLFGVIDELIQGLHPLRTFGHSDLLVNCCGAMAGSLLGSGLKFFVRHNIVSGSDYAHAYLPYFAGLILGVVLLVLPLPVFADHLPPLWLMIPLLVALSRFVEFVALPPPLYVLGLTTLVLPILLGVPYVAPVVFR